MSDATHLGGPLPEHLHDNYGPEARFAVEAEAALPTTRWEEEVARGLELGLPGADSIVDRRIPTFSRGELPHFAGINTFLKAPYVEDVRRCGEYDVAVLGAPFDGGTTYRSGTRFGPQGIRKISALYGPYSFELGVDLRETITIADLGDIFTIPGNIEKTFDQITKAVSHVYASGAFPVVLGGDHSIGYPTTRGVAPHLGGGNLGIIHFDRHVDTQETDLDERMHTTPWFHATDLPNVPAKNSRADRDRRLHAVMSPASESKMNVAGAPAERTMNPPVGLKTRPVGAPPSTGTTSNGPSNGLPCTAPR